jgi:hypothetical protein
LTFSQFKLSARTKLIADGWLYNRAMSEKVLVTTW